MISPIEERKKDNSKVKKVKYEHKEIINQLVKTITDTPMDEDLRMILLMRIWGKSPERFDPMNHLEIAIDIGARESQVRSWEREGLHYVNEHMKKHSLMDSIQRFNEKSTQNKDKLFNPGGKIIKP